MRHYAISQMTSKNCKRSVKIEKIIFGVSEVFTGYLETFYFCVFQAKVNGFTSDKMKDSQTLINAEQIEMDAMEATIGLPSKAKKRLKSKRHVYTLPSNSHNIKE